MSSLLSLTATIPTPFWIYDQHIIRERIASLQSFDTVRFAQKANSNTHLLSWMRTQGVKIDAVSAGEIHRALRAGFQNQTTDPVHAEIVFTADILTPEVIHLVTEHAIPVNAGSIDMLDALGATAPGHPVWLRINPGFGHGHSQKTNTGGEHSKHGIWHTELPQALATIQKNQLQLIGIHMHIGSGVDYQHLETVCDAMVEAVKTCHANGFSIAAISAGGGLSIPYRDTDPIIDTQAYFRLWHQTRQKVEQLLGKSIALELEPGRYLVAESGKLITTVYATKYAGKNFFVLVDAGFNDLMRPSMYGSYHKISHLDTKAQDRPLVATVVAGPLCESGDVFTQDAGGEVTPRSLPRAQIGDRLIIHDAGAYGATMSSNYNSRPLIAEYFWDASTSQLSCIRRAQTIEELLALEDI